MNHSQNIMNLNVLAIIKQFTKYQLRNTNDNQNKYGWRIIRYLNINYNQQVNQVLVWNFTQGKLKLSKQFKEHKNYVQLFSFIPNKQISLFLVPNLDQPSVGNRLIQMNGRCHNIQCLILNKQEDQLISGVLILNKTLECKFYEQRINLSYSLDNTYLYIHQVQTNLRLCWLRIGNPFSQYEKGLEGKLELKSKIDEIECQDQMLTCDKNIDEIMIFELDDEVFKYNENKSIHLHKNDYYQCEDHWMNFSIAYKKNKNLILFSHKIKYIL